MSELAELLEVHLALGSPLGKKEMDAKYECLFWSHLWEQTHDLV